MDKDVAHRGDEGGKGHDKGAGAHGGFQLHAQKGGEHHQHHHTAAGTHKPRSEADGQAEKQGNSDPFPIQFRPLGLGLRPLRAGLYQETDADAEGQDQGEAPQHHVPRFPGGETAHGTHPDDAGQHDPTPAQVDIFVANVGGGGHRGAQDVRGQSDGGGLISPRLPGEGRTQHDENGHHHRGCRQPHQPRPHPGQHRGQYAALEWVWDNAPKLRLDRARIAVGGDSAGGALAAACALRARDKGGPRLCFRLLVYPVTDCRMETASMTKYTDSPL